MQTEEEWAKIQGTVLDLFDKVSRQEDRGISRCLIRLIDVADNRVFLEIPVPNKSYAVPKGRYLNASGMARLLVTDVVMQKPKGPKLIDQYVVIVDGAGADINKMKNDYESSHPGMELIPKKDPD